MKFLLGFAVGTLFGLYYAQNYPSPDIKKEWDKCHRYLQTLQENMSWKDPKSHKPSSSSSS